MMQKEITELREQLATERERAEKAETQRLATIDVLNEAERKIATLTRERDKWKTRAETYNKQAAQTIRDLIRELEDSRECHKEARADWAQLTRELEAERAASAAKDADLAAMRGALTSISRLPYLVDGLNLSFTKIARIVQEALSSTAGAGEKKMSVTGIRSDLDAVIHRFRNRKQTPEQIAWCANLFADRLELHRARIAELEAALTEARKALEQLSEAAKMADTFGFGDAHPAYLATGNAQYLVCFAGDLRKARAAHERIGKALENEEKTPA